MDLFIAGRGKGKTTELVEWMREGRDRAVVFYDYRQAHVAAEQNADLAGWRFLSPMDLRADNNHRLRRELTLGIDELDHFLGAITGHPVEMAALSADVVVRS